MCVCVHIYIHVCVCRYQPVSMQGKGSYGIVVSAYDHELKRDVAIKKVRNLFCDYTYSKRCLLELEVSERECVCVCVVCPHINIIQISPFFPFSFSIANTHTRTVL
jgi:serine/threonine protein kinase